MSMYLRIWRILRKDVTLQDRKTKEKYELTDEGAVISEKTASLTGLKAGDTMTITKDGKVMRQRSQQ